MDPLELKRKHIADLKQFARAEMARDLAHRHGRTLRLPWDEQEQPAAPETEQPGIDAETLQALSGMVGE
jgi:hypothetical protein